MDQKPPKRLKTFLGQARVKVYDSGASMFVRRLFRVVSPDQKHSHDRENARRRRQIEKGMLKPNA